MSPVYVFPRAIVSRRPPNQDYGEDGWETSQPNLSRTSVVTRTTRGRERCHVANARRSKHAFCDRYCCLSGYGVRLCGPSWHDLTGISARTKSSTFVTSETDSVPLTLLRPVKFPYDLANVLRAVSDVSKVYRPVHFTRPSKDCRSPLALKIQTANTRGKHSNFNRGEPLVEYLCDDVFVFFYRYYCNVRTSS